ncbi:hypothetical protein AXF42_Ash018141 [Apostasia shenzhenica]|uniref:Uncharacterized protein n=1 Tax=Apostasia shenzhenica TaxID=1088818 RepID=A0A2I0AF08_9ASPA|nr:hypothetical protein AXF42_Ash018141 [Apostasia shenzhenica]
MASVGNVRLMSYLQAAAGLLLLLLIIISGSAEGWRSTVHHLATQQQMKDACLAAILALNTLAVEHRIPFMLSLVAEGSFLYGIKFKRNYLSY